METLALDTAPTFDKQSLIGIYEKHNSELFRYAYRILGDSNTAEDCVSETFIRFLRIMRDNPQSIGEVRPYLYRIAHNWISDHFRRHSLSPQSLEADLHVALDANSSHRVGEMLELELLRAALLRLPPKQRQVIELRFLEDWPYQAIAKLLGKSVEATRALQHRGLSSLKRLLLEQEKYEDGHNARLRRTDRSPAT